MRAMGPHQFYFRVVFISNISQKQLKATVWKTESTSIGLLFFSVPRSKYSKQQQKQVDLVLSAFKYTNINAIIYPKAFQPLEKCIRNLHTCTCHVRTLRVLAKLGWATLIFSIRQINREIII